LDLVVSLLDVALSVSSVSHRYGSRIALDNVSFDIPRGAVFGLLGPNGSGKSTLFRLISTLVPLQSGKISVFGRDVTSEQTAVRGAIGVVFQSSSLDRKLTVLENLQCQGALFGIVGAELRTRVQGLVAMMGLEGRLHERCEKLSGGLKRRTELAKGLLHRPALLMLDEASTGLDPTARLEFWNALSELRNRWGTTILMTTHLMEEAEKCDSLAIMDQGRIVALASPDALRRETGEMVISVSTREPVEVVDVLKKRFGWECTVSGETVRAIVSESPHRFTEVLDSLGPKALSVTVGRPGLEDVFMRKTGRTFNDS
jgi:ABC-2 type transport system ATP-binding protein